MAKYFGLCSSFNMNDGCGCDCDCDFGCGCDLDCNEFNIFNDYTVTAINTVYSIVDTLNIIIDIIINIIFSNIFICI